jgi:hypothetical protein
VRSFPALPLFFWTFDEYRECIYFMFNLICCCGSFLWKIQIEELKTGVAERCKSYEDSKVKVPEKVLSTSARSNEDGDGGGDAEVTEVISKPISIPMNELQERAGQISVRLAVQDLLLSNLKKENDVLRSKVMSYVADNLWSKVE